MNTQRDKRPVLTPLPSLGLSQRLRLSVILWGFKALGSFSTDVAEFWCHQRANKGSSFLEEDLHEFLGLQVG